MATVEKKSKMQKKDKMEEEKPIPLSFYRTIAETFKDFQHQRIITQNRIRASSKSNSISDEQLALYGVTRLFKNARQFEKDLIIMMEKALRKHELYLGYLKEVVGIGPIMSFGLIAHIDDISKFDNTSKLWQFAGVGMNRYCKKCKEPTHVIVNYTAKTGKKTKAKKLKPLEICPNCGKETEKILQKRTSGYQSNWNPKLRSLCWNLAGSFVKRGKKSFYYGIYRDNKKSDKELHPKKLVIDGKTFWNPGHFHNRAFRVIIKIFLDHLWQEWRKLEGLPVTKPYAATILHHDALEPVRDRK